MIQDALLFLKILFLRFINPGIQLHLSELFLISRTIIRYPNCRLLVFGLGHDSPLWMKINASGKTVFLEDDPKWTELSKNSPGIETHTVQYHTKMSQWREDLNNPAKLEMTLPPSIAKKSWDVVLVDGPCGEYEWYLKEYGKEPPGRAQSTYMAAQLVKDGGSVFVHDCDREPEDTVSNLFFGKENCVKEIKGRARLRYYQIKKPL
jgi:glucuronoxylan 4-O-methyltransferase